MSEGSIPGNTPEDAEWDDVIDWIVVTGISNRALQGLVLGWCKRNKVKCEEPPLK